MRQLSIQTCAILALLVAGCSYRPLYGTSQQGAGVAVALSGIAVEEQKTRASQIVRNNLISAFGRNGDKTLLLRLDPEEKTIVLSSFSSQHLSRKRYTLKINYELAESGSGKSVSTGASFASVSYDTVGQPIADLQAAENARDRAAREVSEDLRLRLAAVFADGG